ncbi:hypothetical protein AMK59_4294 [Oryctes borbonicus]|uniref:TRAF-type domain-containing protein n=1 Tax=Oryctes borbonicus TaxID=1629725 RepID=A0A0T6B5U8_9SCAR|nr:hypothetical protein AMK59_4294 [Oryctes borbonicus]
MMNSNYRPFTCYFCNKLIQRETESIHITTCGSVLEPCKNKCGSYVPRNMRVKHMQECANKRTNTFPRLMKQKRIEQIDSPSSPTSSTSGNGMYNGVSLPPNLNLYRDRERDNERDRERDHINSITNKFLALEQAFAQLQKTTEIIKSRQEQLQQRAATYEHLKLQNEKMQYQNQVLQEWKKNVDMQLNTLNYESAQNIKSRTESERKWSAMIDEKMRLVQDLNANLNSQKDSFLKEQIYNRETQNELQAEIKKFQTFYTQENATVCALWSDQGKQIESVKENITSLTSNLEDQKLKYNTVVFDLRAISQVSSENAEKLEMQERELKELKKSFLQLKIDVEMLEEATNSREHVLPGHIVWKINDFTLKLETAKSNNFVLKGPIFYSHSYGYKIRVSVYINYVDNIN